MVGKLLQCEFLDIDHFREQLSGWDTPAIQIEPGQLRIRLRSLDLGGVVFSDIRVNRRVIDHSRPKADWLKCVINFSPAIFCGIGVGAGHLTILAPGREYRSILGEDWYSIEIVVSSSVLADHGLEAPPHLLFGPEQASIPLPIELVNMFRRLTDTAFGTGVPVDTGALRNSLLRALDKAFWEGSDGRRPTNARQKVEGYELTQRMIRYVESRFGRRIAVNEVARELGVTPRGLYHAVRSTLGMSPLDLISSFRLNQVRNELWDARLSGPSVTAAALAQDYGHLGRFSEQYRALFGELPSETLRRTKLLGKSKDHFLP